MQQFKLLGTALATALALVACGGGGDGNQTPAVSYTSVVSFGDSLSDPGSYMVGPIAALGGGLFTVNGISGTIGSDPVPSYTWAQLVSAAATGKASCAAHTGGFGVARSALVAGCTNYAQGGARVTNPLGTGNKGQTSGVFLAAMTEPVVTQVANYLTDLNNGGKFSGKELVTVLAGANDIFAQTDKLKTDATAAGASALATSLVTQLVAGAPLAYQVGAQVAIATAVQTAATAANATSTSIVTAALTAAATDATTRSYTNTALANQGAAVTAAAAAAATSAATTYAATTGATAAVAGMVTAATELAVSIKGMVANGATHIAVSNLPDVSQTPMAMAQDANSRALILAMTKAFNGALKAGLTGTPGVLFIETFDENQRQMADPAHYALSNITDTACNLNPGFNPLATAGVANSGSSLACKASNLIAGDTSHYAFADSVHPTPYLHKLLAQFANKQLILAGWL